MMSQSNDDAVRSPAHYAGHTGIECREALASMVGRESAADHWVATAVEYLWRWREKAGVQDLRKAQRCIDFAIEETQAGDAE